MDAKKIGIIAFFIIAVIVAGIVIYRTVQSGQIQVVKTVDGGTGTAPKMLAKKAADDAAKQGKPDGTASADKDASGIK